jgi:hypothetical protein
MTKSPAFKTLSHPALSYLMVPADLEKSSA